jgi:hypothetical protein
MQWNFELAKRIWLLDNERCSKFIKNVENGLSLNFVHSNAFWTLEYAVKRVKFDYLIVLVGI